ARLRSHHAGCGVRGGSREAAARDRAAERDRDRAAAYESLCDAEADRAASGGAVGAGEVATAFLGAALHGARKYSSPVTKASLRASTHDARNRYLAGFSSPARCRCAEGSDTPG